jgi:hypothetical protein
MNHQTRVYENIFEMLPNEENPIPLIRINKLMATRQMRHACQCKFAVEPR